MQLANIFSTKETDIRRVIHELRSEDHEPILSSVEAGYFFPANRAEAIEYIATQKSRLHEQSEAMSGVMKGLDKYFEPNLFDKEIV
jgi:prefoldin subunit 5